MNEINKTKDAFEQALFSLLETKNYHDITINEICAVAKKTKMTFYHYYKDKDHLLDQASIHLINNEYEAEYYKIVSRITDLEEIEYESVYATYEWVARHYNQIQNLIYKGETFPLEVFKNALLGNYSRYMTELIYSLGYDIPSDFFSIFCFEGLYGSALYYAQQLKNSKNKRKVKEEIKKVCRLLAKAVMSVVKEYQTINQQTEIETEGDESVSEE